MGIENQEGECVLERHGSLKHLAKEEMMKSMTFRRITEVKLTVFFLLVISLAAIGSGCHSGTVRGAGSDLEKLGQEMKK